MFTGALTGLNLAKGLSGGVMGVKEQMIRGWVWLWEMERVRVYELVSSFFVLKDDR